MSESTVLFVDDQDEILFLIQRMLKEEPYKVLFAKSGKEALEIIEKEKIDVLVTDVLMPEMSGLELLDHVRESHPHIVRIILSGFSQIPTLLSAINHGKIFRYITKPWKVDEDAKKILRDAIAYSKLINDMHTLSMNAFCEFLLKRGHVFLITVEDKIVHLHPELYSSYLLNTLYEPKHLEFLSLEQEYALSPTQKIYVFK